MAAAASSPADVVAADDARKQTTTVSAAWLKANLGSGRVKVLDCSWYLPAMSRDPLAEHAARRIPGARYFDVDRVSDATSSLPHMLPTAAQFAAACDAIGVTNADQVVVYDGAGLFSAARAWWMFRVFGHEAVALLDGGMPAWEKADGAVDENPVDPDVVAAAATASAAAAAAAAPPPKYAATLNASLVRSKADVMARCVQGGAERLVDARPKPRWLGEAPEPRAGLRSGRVPGSACVPFPDLLDPVDKTFKSADQIAAAFRSAGVDLHDPDAAWVASCGTGVTACVLALGAEVAGRPGGMLPVYDGSWAEWGARDSGCPVVGKDDEEEG